MLRFDEQRNATTQDILEEALDTVHEDKISVLTLRSIAQRSGTSQGHMHYYFPPNELQRISKIREDESTKTFSTADKASPSGSIRDSPTRFDHVSDVGT